MLSRLNSCLLYTSEVRAQQIRVPIRGLAAHCDAVIPADDVRQFVRVEGPGGPVFVRRDRTAEAAALDAIRQDGFVQMRMAQGAAAKGRLVFVYRGRDAAECWQRFVTEVVPALQARGWRSLIDTTFGPRRTVASRSIDVYKRQRRDRSAVPIARATTPA